MSKSHYIFIINIQIVLWKRNSPHVKCRKYVVCRKCFVAFFAVLLQNPSCSCDLRCFVAKSVLSLFTRFCVEKNWAKNFVCEEKRTNFRYSLWLSLALPDSLWLTLALSLAHYGSLWLTLALSGSLSGSFCLSLALRICLQSPCLAHKALAQLAAALPRCNTLCWSVVE